MKKSAASGKKNRKAKRSVALKDLRPRKSPSGGSGEKPVKYMNIVMKEVIVSSVNPGGKG
jgi:hypothetical protein